MGLKKMFKKLMTPNTMNISLKWNNVELTSKQKEYITDKIESLSKFFDNITQARIDVGMTSTHHQKGKIYYAHVNLSVPGKTLRVEENEPTIEKAIDKAKDDLQRQLKDYKAKYDKKGSKSIRSTDLQAEAMYHEADMQANSNDMSGSEF